MENLTVSAALRSKKRQCKKKRVDRARVLKATLSTSVCAKQKRRRRMKRGKKVTPLCTESGSGASRTSDASIRQRDSISKHSRHISAATHARTHARTYTENRYSRQNVVSVRPSASSSVRPFICRYLFMLITSASFVSGKDLNFASNNAGECYI